MKGQTNTFVLQNGLQKNLRRNMTDAEQALWRRLRGRQLNGHKFRRQHPFGDYILDFVCLEARLVIEVDGGQHLESQQDTVRDQMLMEAGFQVMRFWNHQVLNEMDAVMGAIWEGLGTHPHPNPPLEGEGAIVDGAKARAHSNLTLEGTEADDGDKQS